MRALIGSSDTPKVEASGCRLNLRKDGFHQAKLYLASRYFLCRNYYRLTYTSQKEGAQTRRLGWVRIVIPLGNSYGPPLTATPIAY